MSYSNINNPVNYQLQGFGQNGVRTISTDQLYIQGEYYRVLVAEEDSYVTAVSVLGDDLTAEFVYAGTTIYGLFTEVSVTSGSLTAYIAGPTDIDDVWAYINEYGLANAATIEAADCAKDAIAPLLDKYYAKASLVMVPSLYKTSIVYSERPLTTDGQLAFTRSNDTATRVGPNGYIEKVRTNIATYSNDFSNAAWAKVSTGVGITPVVTPNYTTDPFGGNDGWRLQCDLNGGTTSSDRSWLQQTIAGTTVPTTVSIYAKLNSAGTATFAVSNGSTDSVTITSTDWVRVSSVRTAAASSYLFRIGLIGGVGQSDSIDISIAFAQLEVGDVMTDYIPTTTTAVSVGPVANVPRLNYPINSDGSVGCPSLLLEPQRTNLVTYSEQFDNAAWIKSNLTITANATTSPDGALAMDKIVEDGSNNSHFSTQTSLTSSANLVLSIFVKDAGDGRFVTLGTNGGGIINAYIVFNPSTGLITQTGASAENVFVEEYNNGIYRVGFYYNNSALNNLGILTALSNVAVPNSRIPSYTGDGTSGIYVWGAQVEAGAYATSYIPTLGATVTRGADACSKTGISSLIGQTQGTLFVEANLSDTTNDVFRGIAELNDGTTANRITLFRNTNGTLRLFVRQSSTTQADISYGTLVTGSVKIAVAYANNDISFYVNGVQVGTDTSATIPACSDFDLGIQENNTARILGDSISQAILFKTRLTNQELQDLTTL